MRINHLGRTRGLDFRNAYIRPYSHALKSCAAHNQCVCLPSWPCRLRTKLLAVIAASCIVDHRTTHYNRNSASRGIGHWVRSCLKRVTQLALGQLHSGLRGSIRALAWYCAMCRSATLAVAFCNLGLR